MRGNPKYQLGDIVRFRFMLNDTNLIKEGTIAIIDKYGTFEDNSDVSYDIYIQSENMLYKHFQESYVIEKIGHEDPPF